MFCSRLSRTFFSAVLILASFGPAHAANSTSDFDLKADIETLKSFGNEVWESYRRYGIELTKPENVKKTATGVAGLLGGMMLMHGASAEILMKVYGVNNPIAAAGIFWQDHAMNFPKLALKFAKPGSAFHARMVARAAGIDRLIAEAASQGALSWLETKTGSRLVMFIGGGLLTTAAVTYMAMMGTAKSEELPESFFETPYALANLFAAQADTATIIHLAQTHEGLAAQIHVMADQIRKLETESR